MQGEKVALVTGNSRGIGCETAFLLLEVGSILTLLCRKKGFLSGIVTSNNMEDMSR